MSALTSLTATGIPPNPSPTPNGVSATPVLLPQGANSHEATMHYTAIPRLKREALHGHSRQKILASRVQALSPVNVVSEPTPVQNSPKLGRRSTTIGLPTINTQELRTPDTAKTPLFHRRSRSDFAPSGYGRMIATEGCLIINAVAKSTPPGVSKPSTPDIRVQKSTHVQHASQRSPAPLTPLLPPAPPASPAPPLTPATHKLKTNIREHRPSSRANTSLNVTRHNFTENGKQILNP